MLCFWRAFFYLSFPFQDFDYHLICLNDSDYVGLLKNKRLFILSTRGDSGYGLGEKNENMNYQTSYLKFVFSMMGVKDTNVISLDNEEYGGAIFEQSKQFIFEKIKCME
ncbi:NAD(P)H-dependent oxidoreductase [Galbibacter marinus]|uniref:NAD(P)H-dependent oxidoreductase n=1 Tax=Galbibacter marinus TaxID=555500 RepID=UPI000A05C998|nr:NAD(P)H-dependent oxidoreductase [Galbibacter marinus]